MSLAEYQKTLQDARGHQLVYFEDFAGDGDEDFLERHFTDNDADPPAIFLKTEESRHYWSKRLSACRSARN
jgi:hypothetical protein